MQVRHPQLDRPGGVHLLAADLRDLVENAEAERQIGVKAAAEFAHQAGAQQQLVRRDFGVGGRFLQGGNEELGPERHEAPVQEQPSGREAN